MENKMDTEDSKGEYNKYAYGLLIIKSNNSNFNADFSGLPRKLPNKEGTFYATDKALKYCIRRYIHDMHPDEKVFAWRRKKDTFQPKSIGENYDELFPNSNGQNKNSKLEIIKNLLTCIDLRLFGITYARGGDDKDAVSFTGPVQISYGVNRLEESTPYSNQISSPYRNSAKSHEDDQQTSIGSESKGLESWYVYDIVINPKNVKDVLDVLTTHNKSKEGNSNEDKDKSTNLSLSTGDVGLLKKALCRGVTYVNTCSKIGSESAMLLFAETTGTQASPIFPMLKDHVRVTKNGNGYQVDLEQVFKILNSSFKDSDLKYELFYDKNLVEITLKKIEIVKEFHIRTLNSFNN